jgi:hypothetical protein
LLVFIVVGTNLPLDVMGDNAFPALAVVAALILLARPVTVAACLLPDRRAGWTPEEGVFLACTRETGVVPVSLAGILIAEGIRIRGRASDLGRLRGGGDPPPSGHDEGLAGRTARVGREEDEPAGARV